MIPRTAERASGSALAPGANHSGGLTRRPAPPPPAAVQTDRCTVADPRWSGQLPPQPGCRSSGRPPAGCRMRAAGRAPVAGEEQQLCGVSASPSSRCVAVSCDWWRVQAPARCKPWLGSRGQHARHPQQTERGSGAQTEAGPLQYGEHHGRTSTPSTMMPSNSSSTAVGRGTHE